jgi:hypothetical protein
VMETSLQARPGIGLATQRVAVETRIVVRLWGLPPRTIENDGGLRPAVQLEGVSGAKQDE